MPTIDPPGPQVHWARKYSAEIGVALSIVAVLCIFTGLYFCKPAYSRTTATDSLCLSADPNGSNPRVRENRPEEAHIHFAQAKSHPGQRISRTIQDN